VWFAIWSGLALAAVGVPALLAVGLWRRVRALGREFALLGERAGAAFAAPQEPPAPMVPTLFASSTASRVHQLWAETHSARDLRRSATLARTLDRWARLGLVGRVPVSLSPQP